MLHYLPFPPIEAATRSGRLSPIDRFVASLASRLEWGVLTLVFPGGGQARIAGSRPGPEATIILRNWRSLRRLQFAGHIGLAQSYRDGDWDTPDLVAALSLGALNLGAFSGPLSASGLASIWHRLKHFARSNTRAGSRRNVSAHYDLGNEFYRLWLDETMTYSGAVFADPMEPLAMAQQRKYRGMASSIDLKPGDRLLEIGCGWGGFAEIAAGEFGCEVVGLTLSAEQAAFARDRMKAAGLSDKVEIRLQDYRDIRGRFDKIVSIEMFEAVGEANWTTFFEVLREKLEPGGKAALQVITINEADFEDYRRNPDFIQMFIFPGGMLPSPARFSAEVAKGGLVLEEARYFGSDYGETLRRWAANFGQKTEALEALGFDSAFRRLWDYYLAYCIVGFDHERVDVGQFVVAHR